MLKVPLPTLALLLFGVSLGCSNSDNPRASEGKHSTNRQPSEIKISMTPFAKRDFLELDKERALSEIREARKVLGEDEKLTRGFLDKFEAEVGTWNDLSKAGESQKRVSSSVSLVRYLIATAPEDLETQLIASGHLLTLSYAMQNLEMDYVPVRAEAIGASRSLVRKFPNEDRAYAELGHALFSSDEKNAEVARSQFETCLKLNPKNTRCRDYLALFSHP